MSDAHRELAEAVDVAGDLRHIAARHAQYRPVGGVGGRQAMRRHRRQVVEDARAVLTILRRARMREWHPNDLDPEQRAVRIRRAPVAMQSAISPFARTRASPDTLHVHDALVGRVGHQGVRVELRHVCTSPTCLGFFGSDTSKMRMPTMRSLLTLSCTPCIPQSSRFPILGTYEQQMPLDRHVALLREARLGMHHHRLGRIRDIPDLEAAEIALVEIVAPECQIGVRIREPPGRIRMEHVRFVAVRDELHALRGNAGVVQTGLEVGARVGGIRLRMGNRGKCQRREDEEESGVALTQALHHALYHVGCVWR